MKKIRISAGLDNVSVGKKLLIMYVLCVLIPILSINLVLYKSIIESVNTQEMNRVQNYMDRTRTTVTKKIQDCVGVAVILSSDISLNDMMEKEYTDALEYYADYRIYLGNALSKYLSSYPQIQRIMLYTDNDTVVDGGNYTCINDGIRNEDWFSKALKNGRNIFVYTGPDSTGQKQLSLIRTLNGVKAKDKYLKILKIDIGMDFFENLTAEDPVQGDLFLVNSNNDIIMSTKKLTPLPAGEIFHKLDEKPGNNIVVSTAELSNIKYLSGWKIVGHFPEKAVFSGLRKSRNFVILLAVISLILTSIIVYFISRSLSIRLKALTRHMKKAKKQNFEIIESGIGNDELGELIGEYNMMATKIKELIQDVYQAEIHSKNLELQKKQAELNALESQINPHFLYNTLNIICMKSLLKSENETAEILKCVAKTFRRVITWGNDFITIGEEVEFIQEYLKIQKYRFENKVNYSIHVQSDCLEYKIPKMSLQTFMENASIHGVEHIKDAGLISLDIYKEDPCLYCIIRDNGNGIEEHHLRRIKDGFSQAGGDSRSIGISNVYRRLSAYYGDSFSFDMENCENGGLKVIIKIPVEEEVAADVVQGPAC